MLGNGAWVLVARVIYRMHVTGPPGGRSIELQRSIRSRLLSCILEQFAGRPTATCDPAQHTSEMLQTGAARQPALAVPACAPHGRRAVIMRALQFRPCIDIHKVRTCAHNGWLFCRRLVHRPSCRCQRCLKAPPALTRCHVPTVLFLQGKVKQIVGSTLQDLQRCAPGRCNVANPPACNTDHKAL